MTTRAFASVGSKAGTALVTGAVPGSLGRRPQVSCVGAGRRCNLSYDNSL